MDSKKEQLAGIVGLTNVSDSPEDLEMRAKDNSFTRPMTPHYVVYPGNNGEVQQLIKWANNTSTPLVPVSSGPPHFYGDTVPSSPGAVIVDLSRMNRIIRINRRNRIAIIEPGVTYSQLQPELYKESLRLPTPLLPRRNKSVIASLLERQPTTVPRYQFAILDPLRCLEVFWGDGEFFRTGEAAGQPSLEESWKENFAQVNPRGPGQTDFYKFVSAAQGTMAIATWASIKCEVLPSVHKLFFIPAEELNDLINLSYRLLRMRFGDEFLILNSMNLSRMLIDNLEDANILKAGFPHWVLLVGIGGREILPEERVTFLVNDIRETAQGYGLDFKPSLPGATGDKVLDILMNPSREPYWKLTEKGGVQDIFFVTTLDNTPDFNVTMSAIAEEYGYPPTDIGVYIQPLHQGTSCHCEFNLPFNPEKDMETDLMKRFYATASELLLSQGAFFSRPYGIWANMVYNRDAKTTEVLKKIKGIFDPNNIMNPGKLCFTI